MQNEEVVGENDFFEKNINEILEQNSRFIQSVIVIFRIAK